MFDFIKKFFKKEKRGVKSERNENLLGLGAVPDKIDDRDLMYTPRLGASPVDWKTGYDVEKDLNIKIPIKSQNGSGSCVAQAWSYYVAVLNAVETGKYVEDSAKAIFSQIHLSYGAYIRDGGKLITNWGSLNENVVPSYDKGKPPKDPFMEDLSWKTSELDKKAAILKAKKYKCLFGQRSMDDFARAIKENHGVVTGVYVGNNGSWRTFEPTPSKKTGGHALYLGKFGIDERGKYIATPNSWGTRKGTDALHPDGWQKLRESYFNSSFIFNPWTLTDKPNPKDEKKANVIMKNNEKKIIIEGEGSGRKGVIINGKLREILDHSDNRAAAACLYVLVNNGFGETVSTEVFDAMEKKQNF